MENFSAHYAYVHDTVRPVSQNEKLYFSTSLKISQRRLEEDLKKVVL